MPSAHRRCLLVRQQVYGRFRSDDQKDRSFFLVRHGSGGFEFVECTSIAAWLDEPVSRKPNTTGRALVGRRNVQIFELSGPVALQTLFESGAKCLTCISFGARRRSERIPAMHIAIGKTAG